MTLPYISRLFLLLMLTERARAINQTEGLGETGEVFKFNLF